HKFQIDDTDASGCKKSSFALESHKSNLESRMEVDDSTLQHIASYQGTLPVEKRMIVEKMLTT
ncbi:uncharacterized protein A4U43_C10F12750, partial [Asparagus officinalis]